MAELFKGIKQLEQAREEVRGASFMAGLYLGKPDFDLLLMPSEPEQERLEGEAYCRTIEDFLKQHVDPEEIERTGEIPEPVLQGLIELGAFAMKIPKQYGGLGFSHRNYGRVLTLIASWSNILSLTVAVPQSIGIAMPILLFGNEQQKQQYLPQVARQCISAFALTEPDTGSDAANIKTEAVLTDSGDEFVINGQKLWCTNGAIARFITLVARVPVRKTEQDGKVVWQPVSDAEPYDDKVHTAFILDMQSPGVEVKQRCRFAGCRGIANAHICFKGVRVPRENIIGDVGAGLKYALSILNIGRAVSVPAICLGMAKQAWQPTLDRLNFRMTFGEPLANRQTQRIRVGEMAKRLFVMEALCDLVWQMADQHRYDVRMEAAVTKMFCSEHSIAFLNDAQIIFGGMGYEAAESKKARGEPAFPMEQLVRDATMYRIGEGATDILRPFVAREALNFHWQQNRELLERGVKGRLLLDALSFYMPWYLSLWLPKKIPNKVKSEKAKILLGYVEHRSRALARGVAYALLLQRQGIQEDQGRQNRIEQIGEKLFALAAAVLHAQTLDEEFAWVLVAECFRTEKAQIKQLLWELLSNDDRQRERLGRQAVEGDFDSLSGGGVLRNLDDYRKGSSNE